MPSYAGKWDGGSRTTYSAIELSTGRSVAVSDNVSAPWDKSRQDKTIPLRAGFAIVRHDFFRGKDFGLTFYVHPSDIVKLIPEQAKDDLCEVEVKTLAVIRGLKSAYRADQFRRMGLSAGEVEAIKGKLTRLGYINKAGAITVAGRNRSEGVQPY